MTRRPRPALFGALGVTVFLIAVDLAQTLINYLPYAVFGPMAGFVLLAPFGQDVLIGIGVFLVFWLLTTTPPGTSTIRRAIGAGALAAAGGAVLVAVGDILMALVFAREASGSLYDLIPLNLDPIRLIADALSTALHLLPLTVLAAVLVREWLRSRAAVDAPKEPAQAV